MSGIVIMKMINPQVLSRIGSPFLFIHANGYPPEAYQSFLVHFLENYQVITLSLRPFLHDSDPASLKDWRDFRDDYLGFIDDQDSKMGFPMAILLYFRKSTENSKRISNCS